MSDVTVSVETVEEVLPVELSADLLDDQLIGKLVDRARSQGLHWTMRWKPALQAFDIAFDGRLSVGRR